MAEILLHKNPIDPVVAERLSSEGVIAIQTDDLEGFRFLPLEPASIRTDDFLWAALDGLAHASIDTSKGAHRLVKNLSVLAQQQQEKKAT